ncbi:MAG TPA: type I restriction endonuclease subunit R [Desulfosporosinus sp.]|nr:type I restriction endonuclease subunit R [Desulfosporosinus sp.]
MTHFTESVLEEAVIEYFVSHGFQIRYGLEIAPGEHDAFRQNYQQVLLKSKLQEMLVRINPNLPNEAIEDASRKIINLPLLHPGLEANNRAFHKYLNDGVDIEYCNNEGRIIGDKVWLVDFVHPENNDFLAVNQFTIIENHNNRRPDVIIFLNGIPIGVIELKNPADENATIRKAFQQIQTYKKEIPTLFVYNELVIISDGIECRVGSFTSPWERMMPWRTMDGEDIAPATIPQIEVLIKGIFNRHRLLDLLHHFIVFNEDDGKVVKKVAAYHQFFAVNKALQETIEASSPKGDRRIGIIWHTQGSGKSLTMAFFAGKVIAHPKMRNPTLVILTDRNDLDDQLFGTFSTCKDLIRQTPVQAKDRQNLRELLSVSSGGVVFSTVQKFMPDKGETYPTLSERTNIVVIADEAHRSQYDFIDGFARHMRDALPHASFIGFTGTPIELSDRNTKQVFGDIISVYDVERAIEDKVTVPIYYEARLAKIDLLENERPKVDKEFEDVTEGEEEFIREKLKSKWARLEAMVGAEKRLKQLAEDIVNHFEARLDAMDGKGMIVTMSRRIAVDLFEQIIRLRPQWQSEDDAKGVIKVIMTGSASDPDIWQKHIRNKAGRKDIEKRFKDPSDPMKLVIVRDMWLTGFDVPPLHTMYVDKPMKGHGLMQAIARVNRVFSDKPGGLIVDYLGIAESLKEALAEYTTSGGAGEVALDQEEAVAVMLEKYEIVFDLFNGFNWSLYFKGTAGQKMSVIPQAMEHILAKEKGKERLLQHVTELSKAFALSIPHPEAIRIRDDVGFFQAVRAGLVKTTAHKDGSSYEDLDYAVRQIVSRAVAPQGVVDIFTAAGLPRPDISILSNEFMEGIKNLPQKHLAVELLQKLLNDEIKTKARTNLVLSRSFSDMLKATLQRYQSRSIEAAQVISELIEMAKQFQLANQRGVLLGLNDDELAFYDALSTNDSAKQVLGDKTLSIIAREVLQTVRGNVTIDWTVKESVRANLRRMVKRILRKYGYPPDMQEQATVTVLEQAELLAKDWAD